MACVLRGNLLEEMSFWIAATVDDTCIPPATEDHHYVLVRIYLEGSPRFWAWCGRARGVVMCPKWEKQEAEPAAYRHLAEAISFGCDSDEGACFPPGELRQEKRELAQAIKETSIGSAALGARRNRACFFSGRSPMLKSRPRLSWEQKNRSAQSFTYGFIGLLKLIVGFAPPFSLHWNMAFLSMALLSHNVCVKNGGAARKMQQLKGQLWKPTLF